MTDTKRNKIMEAALALFVQEGLDGAGTAKIAQAAGVAKGTLFHHFTNKQELISALYLEIKQEMAENFTTKTNVPWKSSPPTKGSLGPESPPQAIGMEPQQDLLCFTAALWRAGMDWAMANTDKIRFLSAYYQSPTLSAEARNRAKYETLGFVRDLLKLGKQEGLFAGYPDELMMEMCHTLFLTCAIYFIEHPELAREEREQKAAMAMFWNALASPGNQIALSGAKG